MAHAGKERTGSKWGIGMMVVAFTLSLAGPSLATDDWKAKVKPLIEKAHTQMELALTEAEEALGPHRKGSAWVRTHMQRAVNILGGSKSPAYFEGFRDPFQEKVGNPGDGTGLIPYLEQAEIVLQDNQAPRKVQQAIDFALKHTLQAIEQANESVAGAGIRQTHTHAGTVAAMLVAAHGKNDTGSPVTGTLTYAMSQVGIQDLK
ncbi:MAG: hypothetical protein NPIRA04_02610 [Nitrospirales bacterium]|nr:MAG: hypothetical protein NPIRA04_02610 [Nitrospirales bacterium]